MYFSFPLAVLCLGLVEAGVLAYKQPFETLESWSRPLVTARYRYIACNPTTRLE